MMDYSAIEEQARLVASELLDISGLHSGDILIVGCSTSEVLGERIGTASSEETARAIYNGIKQVTEPKGVFLAAQCCEHLNRAVVIENDALPPWYDICNAVPQPHAGGSFATLVYKEAKHPVVVERIKAGAGIDIGGTLIGMHLKEVAVPVRLSLKHIGKASIICARTRPKYIGGERTHYDISLSGGDIKR